MTNRSARSLTLAAACVAVLATLVTIPGCSTTSRRDPTTTSTITLTPTRTRSFTRSQTFSPTSTASRTITLTPSITNTRTFTRTFTISHTRTETRTFTETPTETPTFNPVGYIAVMDGSSSVHVAPIAPWGGLGSFATTTPYPQSVQLPGTAVDQGWVYVVGGDDGSGPTTTAYAAPLGTAAVGPWQTVSALPVGVAYGSLNAVGGYLFLTGGYDVSFAYLSTVYVAQITSPGTLGSWTTTASLPQAIVYVQAATDATNAIYVKGYDSGGFPSDVFVGTVSGGAISAWATASPVPTPGVYDSLSWSGGTLFNAGGYDPNWGTAITRVAGAPAGATVGAWGNETALPVSRSLHSTAVGPNGEVFIVGGYDFSSGNIYADVLSAPVSGGVLGSWSTAGALPSGMWFTNSFIW